VTRATAFPAVQVETFKKMGGFNGIFMRFSMGFLNGIFEEFAGITTLNGGLEHGNHGWNWRFTINSKTLRGNE